jgi:acetolactate synthase-1/2/3 large subunit
MRVSDYIAEKLYSSGVTQVYGLMGGGASGLNDGFIKHGKIKYICFHHEQGAAYAAYGEARSTGKIAVINPTTGCGGTNCMTPLLNAWQDSVPLVFISGNVRNHHTTNYLNRTRDVQLRKYGVQEHDIINNVKTITKYSAVVESPSEIKRMLEKAITIATSGRKGPVWLDIPSDVQTASLENINLTDYDPYADSLEKDQKINLTFERFEENLYKSKRPILIAGGGIPSNKRLEFRKFVEKYDIPVVTTYISKELLPYSHKLNLGVIGIKGTRAANFAMQHSDFLAIMGCSLNAVHVGYDEKQFAPFAYKVMFDIDANEFYKYTVKIDEFVKTDLEYFFNA